MADTNNDIHIGENKVIKWIECDPSKEQYKLDLAYTKLLWEQLEIECITECCGIYAFNFYPENIVIANINLNDPEIKKHFINLRNEVLATDKSVISNDYINHFLDKTLFIQLLDHIILHLS